MFLKICLAITICFAEDLQVFWLFKEEGIESVEGSTGKSISYNVLFYNGKYVNLGTGKAFNNWNISFSHPKGSYLKYADGLYEYANSTDISNKKSSSKFSDVLKHLKQGYVISPNQDKVLRTKYSFVDEERYNEGKEKFITMFYKDLYIYVRHDDKTYYVDETARAVKIYYRNFIIIVCVVVIVSFIIVLLVIYGLRYREKQETKRILNDLQHSPQK